MNSIIKNYQANKKFFEKIITIFFVIIVFLIPVISSAQVTINPNLPGAQIQSSDNNPCTIVINFYWFAIFISGILAFGAIVYGGIKYQISAGNPGSQSEGKKWIMGALEGIVLLFASYLILQTINPALTKCQWPELQNIQNNNVKLPQQNKNNIIQI